jgi:hypothetical protein
MSDQINANGKPNKPRIVRAITGKELSRNGAAHLDAVRPSLVEGMRKDHPDLKDDAFVSRAELDRYRSLYVTKLLRAESGDLSEIENQVAQNLATHGTLPRTSRKSSRLIARSASAFQNALASFGGSWSFLIVFAAFLAVWMLYNFAPELPSIPIRMFF